MRASSSSSWSSTLIVERPCFNGSFLLLCDASSIHRINILHCEEVPVYWLECERDGAHDCNNFSVQGKPALADIRELADRLSAIIMQIYIELELLRGNSQQQLTTKHSQPSRDSHKHCSTLFWSLIGFVFQWRVGWGRKHFLAFYLLDRKLIVVGDFLVQLADAGEARDKSRLASMRQLTMEYELGLGDGGCGVGASHCRWRNWSNRLLRWRW